MLSLGSGNEALTYIMEIKMKKQSQQAALVSIEAGDVAREARALSEALASLALPQESTNAPLLEYRRPLLTEEELAQSFKPGKGRGSIVLVCGGALQVSEGGGSP